jgi:hypothetical protein
MSICWLWIPGESVGPFRFGEEADRVIKQERLIKLEPDIATADWDTYAVPNCESRVYVKNGKVTAVLCEESLYYKNVELLGLSLDEIRNILGKEDELVENRGLGDAVYYDRTFGLTLWTIEGLVNSATCESFAES